MNYREDIVNDWTDGGGPDPSDEIDYEACVRKAIASLPEDLRSAMSNVAIDIDDVDPEHPNRLGVYRGIPLTRRTRSYVFQLPDRITIYRGTLERYYGRDRERLEREVRRVVIHEIAHHFGISDTRLRDLDAY